MLFLGWQQGVTTKLCNMDRWNIFVKDGIKYFLAPHSGHQWVVWACQMSCKLLWQNSKNHC